VEQKCAFKIFLGIAPPSPILVKNAIVWGSIMIFFLEGPIKEAHYKK
jgi:hypothetical protein